MLEAETKAEALTHFSLESEAEALVCKVEVFRYILISKPKPMENRLKGSREQSTG